ncbi:hypothetical protein H0H81_012100 [Sphagnurus paluster]|uniref:Uncharacterized protein n=1 Tax=Sphagnurus paluster TaxID=117069 RepID=A0A9P7KKF4_9AGAR|nr:hypothetical protein H0H81_012100 [Sphagnurus paluster]
MSKGKVIAKVKASLWRIKPWDWSPTTIRQAALKTITHMTTAFGVAGTSRDIHQPVATSAALI